MQDMHGNTALWRAVYESRGRGEMIRILCAHGADKNLRNKNAVSPEELARTIANYDVMQFFD
jgi:ankyrin repeat protein